MVCWWLNTEALHLVKQGGALQAKSGSGASRTSEFPVRALASREDFSTHLVFKGWVWNLALRRLVAFERQWFKDAVIRENDPACDMILQLPNVAGPVVAHQGAHCLLRNRFD